MGTCCCSWGEGSHVVSAVRAASGSWARRLGESTPDDPLAVADRARATRRGTDTLRRGAQVCSSSRPISWCLGQLGSLTQIACSCRYPPCGRHASRELDLEGAEPARTTKLGSQREFEEMYVAAWPRLCRYTWVLIRHHEDAEDIAAETVRRAYGAWQAGRGP